MWDVEKYRSVIKAIKENGTFKESNIKSKEQIYELIGKAVGVEKDTAKSWTRESSSGPGDNNLVANVEKALGITVGLLGRREEKPMKKEKQRFKLTDFNKNAIQSCYMLMKEYIHSDEVEDEDCFANMCAEVGKYRIAIPEEIYKEIQQCIDEFLAPIVYEYRDTFALCFADDIGYWGNDDIWHIKDEEGMRKSCMYFIMKLVEIEESVDNFAMEKLYPVLVDHYIMD